MTLQLRSGRWKCRKEQCARKTFVEKLAIALPFAPKTRRVGEPVWRFGHAAGGRVSERLPAGGIPISESVVLRQLKSQGRKHRETRTLRAIAIDDWNRRKAPAYGTIIVDLERRMVADVLKTRSAQATADWLSQHPGPEIVSRGCCGLYAQGIRKGAPTAKQVADRFHLRRNSQENIIILQILRNRQPGEIEHAK